jgi:hypothetical protein
MAIALTGSKDSPPPLIADVVAGHNQLVDFDSSSGSTSIDDDKLFAKNLINEALEKRSALWVEGKDGEVALFEIIKEKNLSVDLVSDDDISVLVYKYPKNLRSHYGMEHSHKAMIVYDCSGNICLAFTCMQIASAIASPANVHRLGNCAIGFFHEWIRGFLVIAGAPRHCDIFPPFTTAKKSILHDLLTNVGSTKVTALLQDDGILPIEVKYNIGQAKKGKKASLPDNLRAIRAVPAQDDGILPIEVKYKIGQAKKGKKASLPDNLRAIRAVPACLTSDCHKNAKVFLTNGTYTGYCFACAVYEPVLLSGKKSAMECSVDGCSYRSKVTVGDMRFCDNCNPDEESKRRRKADKRLYDAKRSQEKKAKLSV